jgi:hypothetical protein
MGRRLGTWRSGRLIVLLQASGDESRVIRDLLCYKRCVHCLLDVLFVRIPKLKPDPLLVLLT